MLHSWCFSLTKVIYIVKIDCMIQYASQMWSFVKVSKLGLISTAVQWFLRHKTDSSTAYSRANTQPTAWDCLLLFYGWVRGRLFYCLLWVVIVFFIMILVSWLSDDSLFHICLFTSSLLLIWLILLWFWKKRHSAVLLFFSRDEATFSLIGIHWKSRTLSQQI